MLVVSNAFERFLVDSSPFVEIIDPDFAVEAKSLSEISLCTDASYSRVQESDQMIYFML